MMHLHLPFAQKFSKPKSIIDELSAWSWEAPRRMPFIDLNLWQIKRRLLQVILVPFIWANQPHFVFDLVQKA